jgi:hypothetical protein
MRAASSDTDTLRAERTAFIGIIVYASLIVCRTVIQIWSHDTFSYFVTDDFYYYFLTAKNFVQSGRSTFDGITLTNGYHPLWFVSITGLTALSFGSDRIFFLLLSLVSASLVIMTYRSMVSILGNILKDNLLRYPAAFIAAVLYGQLYVLGMEITLAVPLLLLFIARALTIDLDNTKDTLLLGFIGSLTILSRLDAVLLIAVVTAAMYDRRTVTLRTIVVYFAGMILIPIYLLTNIIFFGHLFTVSSSVKTLHSSFSVNVSFLLHILTARDGLGVLILAPIALYVYRKRSQASQRLRRMVTAIISSVYFYYIVIALLSDWMLFRWYLYPMPFLFGIIAVIVTDRAASAYPAASLRIGMGAAAVLFAYTVTEYVSSTFAFTPQAHSPYAHAKAMTSFTERHRGTYAMGDRAGITAYLCSQPFVQIEGLAADWNMYEHIKNGSDLIEVLRSYHVDYLIETAGTGGLPKDKNGCYLLTAPHTEQAGARSPKMSGVLCSEPLFHYQSTGHDGSEVHTYIFAVPER